MAATDIDLLERMRRGDGEAFALLYARHHQRVYRFALLYAGHDGYAADVTQEVFMALIDNVRFDPTRGVLEAYLLGMARNLVRRQQREGLRFESLDTSAEEWSGEEVDEPALLAGRAQQNGRLRAAILDLPAHQREIVILCELEELDYREAAALLEIPIGTVRSRLNRARAALARTLAPDTSPCAAPTGQEEAYELRAV